MYFNFSVNSTTHLLISSLVKLLCMNDILRTSPTQKVFKMELVEQILLKSQIYIAGIPHHIAEIELYYYSSEHPDTFIHKHELQRETGKWYFHRSGKSYRGGTFKGLNITIGDGTNYGSLLIRGLICLSSGEVIKGPCRCVDYILRLCGYSCITELVEVGLRGDLDIRNEEILRLVATSEKYPIRIQKKKRLDAYKPLFIDREYNFSVYR